MKLSVWLTGLAGCNAALGLIYNWYLLTTLGPGRPTDALFASLMVPQLLGAVLGGSLSNVLVPALATENEQGFARLGWTIFQAILLAGTAAAVLLGLSAPLWVPITVPGFEPEATRVVVSLLRIQVIGVVLALLSMVQRAAYNARHRFLWPEASASLAILASLGFLVAELPILGVAAAAWATVIRSSLQVTFLLPALGRYRWPVWAAPELRHLWHRWRPLLLGSLYYKSDLVLDRLLASLAPSGLLSLYYLATQLWSSGYLILSKAIAAPAVPHLAQAAASHHWRTFRRINHQRLGVLLLIAVLTYLLLLVAGRPVLSLFVERNRFTPDQVRQLWSLLVALGGVWIGGAAGQIIATSFYAQGETRRLTQIGAFWFTVGIVLKVTGFQLFGLWGVALGASLSFLASAAAQQLSLERRYRQAVAGKPLTPSSLGT